MNYRHKSLAEGRWAQMTLREQMLNIGSEVSRANKWKKKGNEDQCVKATYRALELVSLTIDAQKGVHCLKEFTRLYEVLCDFFLGDNIYHSDAESLQRYFDVFAHNANKQQTIQ